MKAITQGKVLIRLASSISTPLKSPEGLNDLQTDFDFFFWSAVLRLTRCSLYYRLRWRHTSRKAAANWKRTKPHGSSRGKNEGIIRCVSVSTSHLCRIVHLRSMAERKSWVIKVAHVQYINSRYSIQRMMMVKKKRPKEWVGRGAGRIQQSDEEERCYSCVSNPMWTFELDIWPR